MGKLIRLELFNFKSYKGHHTLLFGDSYFTSIIGPNGSGKSNSMDAISFVLGLRSAQLRSVKLEDLVYRGRVLKTSKINDDGSAAAPNGYTDEDGLTADGKAQTHLPARGDPRSGWVMAIYEDDAGDEQRWKRTITPQNNSEYRINDHVVTAKQYHEAMESENILIKARNFLVFQGDVEAIASQSPEQLTNLIEQISGSLEYKEDFERLQTEASQAAEDTSYALGKRRGVGAEVRQYQEQKREAQSYQNKVDERDKAIVSQVLWKLLRFQNTLNESNSAIQEHQENLKEYRRGVEKYDSALQEARGEESKVKKEVSKIERVIASKEKEIEFKQDTQLTGTLSALEKLSGKVKDSTAKAAHIRAQRDEIVKDCEQLKKQILQVEKAKKDFEAEWKEKMEKQGKQQLSDADLREYRVLRAKVTTKTSNDQTQLEALLRQKNTDDVTINSLKTKVEGSKSLLKVLESELREITLNRDNFKSEVKARSKEIEDKKKEFKQLQYTRTQNNTIRREEMEKLEAILKELDEADDGRKRSDRDIKAREIVNEMKRAFPDRVKGRVGDLCKPKQKKYSDAVGIALGREFESVIVDTETTGRDCIQYLKQHTAGTMTFIPLDNIKYNTINADLKSFPKARLTIDTIDFDSSIERAMAYACSNSIICDNLTTAKDIIYGKGGEKGFQVKAVTLDGILIHKNGSMTGGRSADKGNKRKFDDNDIENLRVAALSKREKIDRLPESARASPAEDLLSQQLTILDQTLAHARGQLAGLEQNYASKKKELEHEKKRLNEMRPRYEEKVSSLEALQEKIEEFEKSIARVQDLVFGDFCKKTGYADIRAYEALQGSLQHEAAEKRSELDTHKQELKKQLEWRADELAKISRRIEQFEATISGWQLQLEQYESSKEIYENEIDRMRVEVTETEDRLHRLKERLASKSEKVKAASKELSNRSKEIDKRTKAISALEGDLYRCNSQRHALLRHCKLNQIKVPLAEGSKGLESLSTDEFIERDPDAMDIDEGDTLAHVTKDSGILIDFEKLDERYGDPDDDQIEGQLDATIQTLSSELEKLNPNMRAIERLEGVEVRYNEVEEGYQAKLKAAKAAREAFNEVKTKRNDLFNKAFAHISGRIDATYKDLTRSSEVPLGGYASLDIEDSDAPYLSGIKFHAVPPLKRFREMEHLSGGEKTMAAMALLFSIHSYQPSPFFVLDEVDAALDNANVEKIKTYIKNHAGPGMQFIVISLKTGLFQGSESLVGVFRDQEANTSKTLTLDLRKYVH